MTSFKETATAQPGFGTSSGEELARWLSTPTALGDILFHVRDRFVASKDPAEQRAQGGIVPMAFVIARLRR